MQNMIFVLYPLFCILLPCMLYVLIQTKGFHQRTNFIHMIWVFIFLYYVYLVLETTGIGTIWEIGLYPGMKLQEEPGSSRSGKRCSKRSRSKRRREKRRSISRLTDNDGKWKEC